jgi:hypothetical protein
MAGTLDERDKFDSINFIVSSYNLYFGLLVIDTNLAKEFKERE